MRHQIFERTLRPSGHACFSVLNTPHAPSGRVVVGRAPPQGVAVSRWTESVPPPKPAAFSKAGGPLGQLFQTPQYSPVADNALGSVYHGVGGGE